MTAERFSDFLLFEELSSDPWGRTFRAGHIHGRVVDYHARLILFDGPDFDRDSFWRLVAGRRTPEALEREPHLGQLCSLGRLESIPFAAYRHEPGITLSDFFVAARAKDFPIPTDQALFIIERVALALRAAFDADSGSQPLLHGFLVPDLVYLTGDGEVQVLGLEVAPGLRRLLASHPTFRRYLAPEAASGAVPSPTEDVFSLGRILSELLLAKMPSAPAGEAVESEIAAVSMTSTDTPMPESLRDLLLYSLASADERIRNVSDWQQKLSALILNGDYNPTTFNLSFLLHTLLTEEIAEETERMATERRIRPPHGPSQSLPPPVLPIDSSPGRGISPFFKGLLLSFSATIALIITVLAMQSAAHSKNGAVETTATAVAEEAHGEGAMARANADLGTDGSAFSAAVGETASPDSPEQPVLEEPAIPGKGTGEPARADLEEIVDSRVKDVEASLREEYERQLAELRIRLAASRKEAEVEASSARQGDRVSTSQRRAAATEPDSADPGAARIRPPISPTSSPGTSTSDSASEGLRRTTALPPTSSASPPVRSGSTVLPAASPAQSPESGSPAADPDAEHEPKSAATDAGLQAAQRPLGVEVSPSTIRQPAADQATVADAEPAAADAEPAVADAEPAVADAEAPDNSSFEPPRLVQPPRPVYPAAARRVRRAATVRVRVVVGSDGAVTNVELLDEERAGFGLDQAALAAARRSEWAPATRLGEPVEASVVLAIEFQP